MRDDELKPLFGILIALELNVNQRVLKLLTELLRNGGRLIIHSNLKSRSIACENSKDQDNDQAESVEENGASSPGLTYYDVRLGAFSVFRHEFNYILWVSATFSGYLSPVIYSFTSNLISDQMKGSATSPPTTIPNKAVSTAEPGTITARA